MRWQRIRIVIRRLLTMTVFGLALLPASADGHLR
jgi:hypothetical protein